MSEKELININGIREDLYQAMQIGDITLSSKHSQELYDFMNYQDKENDQLKKRNKELEDGFKAATEELCEYAEEHETFELYKKALKEKCEAIDKAIEYVEENITSFRKIELLNILQGDDNNAKDNK